MTQALAETNQDQPPPLSRGTEVAPSRTVDWRRLRSPLAVMALVWPAIAALGTTAGTGIAGQLAEDRTRNLVVILVACRLGPTRIDHFANGAWVGRHATAGRA